jgi:hypothetical protein
MLLTCGSEKDRFIQEFRKLGPCHHLDESDLFACTPFQFERNHDRTAGYLITGRQQIPLREISGVVLRLPRAWWPSTDFHLQDQMFVYHETMASWFALIDILDCPVVNRFGLGWWLQDLVYPLELRMRLATALHLGVTADEQLPQIQSIYRSGGLTIPGPGCGRDLLSRLDNCGAALAAWERQSGISLSRIDFLMQGATPRIHSVEPYPDFSGEAERGLPDAARAAHKRITAHMEVAA